MSVRRYNLEEWIESIYGFKVQPFEVQPVSEQPQTTARQNGELVRLVNGKPYFLPVILDGIHLQHCVMSVSSRKHIVSTQMVARKGAVKELISFDDLKISLNGFFIGENGHFPDTQIDQLVQIYEKNEAITLRSALSDYFLLADDKVIMRDLTFPEMRGVTNVRNWKCELESDVIFELII
jgi:hypothetical protein